MLKVTVDKTGFPIVELPELRLAVSWLPLTKVQLEHFIADKNDPLFNQDRYDIFIRYNARLRPRQMDVGNYGGVFLTGILPEEAQLIAEWMGDGFDLPTSAEWKAIFDYFYVGQASSEVIKTVTSTIGISARARQIIIHLDTLTKETSNQLLGDTRRICDQMLMRLGVMEYIYENDYHDSFAGQGQPNKHFHAHSRTLPRNDAENLADHIKKTGGRVKQYGCRLIRRG